MKKLMVLVFGCLMLFFTSACLACENCDCDNPKCNCKKECLKDCDCGCHKGEKCTCKDCKCKCHKKKCSKDCDCGCNEGKDCTCEKCNCDNDCKCKKSKKSFKNIFKRNKIKCNCEE